MKPIKFEFNLTGFIIALIIIAMFTTSIGLFIAENESNLGISGESSFYKYNYTNDILNDVEQIRDKTDIKPDKDVVDVIGGYFTSGYTALKVSVKSLSLFDKMLTSAGDDVEGFSLLKTYIFAIVLIGIILGVIITVLVKMRI